jgi:hypothetical protein
MRTRVKIYAPLLLFSSVLAAARLAEPSLMEWRNRRIERPEPATPPVEEWPKLALVVNPTLHCPTPVICRGSSHLGPYVAPYEPCCWWRFDALLAANERRIVRMQSGDGFSGERFQLAFLPTADGGFEVGALGRSFIDMGPPFTSVLQGLTGSVTINTLDWREHQPIHVRFELRYYYDDDPAKWSTIEVCSEAIVSREK